MAARGGWGGQIRRPSALANAAPSGGDVRLKVFYHDGRRQAFKGGQPVGQMSVKIDVGGHLSVHVDGHKISLKAMQLEIVD